MMTGKGFGASSSTVSPAKATLLIDSLESLLPKTPNHRKAGLYDTLASLAEVLSQERSLDYYLALYNLPDSLVSYHLKVKATRKIAGIYLNINRIDQANHYIDAYAAQLQKYPQQTGNELIKQVAEKNAQAIKTRFTVTRNEVLILLLLFIAVAVLSLSYLYRRFKSVESKKQLLQRESEIIRLKNQELEEALEKTIQSKTSSEEAEIVKVRKAHLRLKKELKKLEESIYNRNAFLSGLGPELRTALSSILGFSSELKTEVEKLENDDLQANATDLFAKNLQLDVILENMVDRSGAQINLLSLDIQSHSVLSLIEKVTASLQYLVSGNPDKLKVNVPQSIPTIKADADKLVRILNDVVINVDKLTATDTITIGARTNQSRSEVSVYISNTVRELSRTGLEQVKKEGGTPQLFTALFASRELITAMGGSMQISMVPGEGVTVTVTLPASASAAQTEKLKEKTTTHEDALANLVRDADIFLVEDDRMNRMVIETMLKDAGTVTTAVDGDETLQIIEKYHDEGKVFDIMLFDINLPPPWDGIALMHRIKKDFPEYRKVPFVAQTAYAMAADRDRFLNEGFDDYLTKPINKGELLTIMHHQLELFKEQRSNPASKG